MAVLPQLERQYLQANLSQVQALLADCTPDEDPIGHHQYSQLVDELKSKLVGISDVVAKAPAGVALFFGGRPVIGSHGIQAEFGSKILDRFQKIVSQRYASTESGPLATRGRVPFKDNTHLLITDVVRGSFGFVLQAAQDDASDETDTSLKAVVDNVASTISRVAAQDDMLFDEAVSEIDERQKNSLSEFFKLLDTEGATMRIVEGERDFELDQASVQRARGRVEGLQISEKTQELTGQIVGWSDVSAKFELKLHGSLDIVQGTVSRAELERVETEGIETYHKHLRASVKVREVMAKNRAPKLSYTLMSLEVINVPPGWQQAPSQRVIQ
jgi:hypothetical protein